MRLQSYRAKLLLNTTVLMLLLGGSLLYTYNYVRDLLIQENNNHLASLSQVLRSQIEYEKNEFQRYADIVSEDLRIKQYMFVVVNIGNEPAPLQKLYQRQFGWLPISRYVIVSNDHKLLAGTKHADLASALRSIKADSPRGALYFYGKHGLELVAYSPIIYRGSHLGTIAVSYFLDEKWFSRHQQDTGGELFLVRNNQVVQSSVSGQLGKKFKLSKQQVELAGHSYRVHPMIFAPAVGEIPRMWFALPETSLVQRLEKHRLTLIVIVSLSMAVILLFGFIIARNFTQPLTQLINITREVANGHLPKLDKSHKKNEITELSNHFADMLQALREKQREIDRVHAALEKTAITDNLTGLYNRHQLSEVFPKLQAQARRSNHSLFAILIDLDKFKLINDNFGHICGDVCLQHFANRLREVSRASDYLFRMGGEEFLLLTVGDDTNGIIALAEKLRTVMENTSVEYEGRSLQFTISCGISSANLEDEPTISIKNMLNHADTALYLAKKTGRNRVRIDEDLAA